jgi:hypothetical protein
MLDIERTLEQLIQEMGELNRERNTVSYPVFVEKKATIYLAFAEKHLPSVPSEDPEFDEYICQMRAGAMTLRAECARVLRNGYSSEEALTNVREEDEELGALLENICLLLKPEMLQAVDAVV